MRKHLLTIALLCTGFFAFQALPAQNKIVGGVLSHPVDTPDDAVPAQRTCLTVEKSAASLAAHPELAAEKARIDAEVARIIKEGGAQRQGGVITIPVVVHVLYENSTQNISDAQILSQIDVLNDDYRRTNADASNTVSQFVSVAADCEIEFCMAQRDPNGSATTGITRTATSTNNIGSTNQYYQEAPIWNRNNYLNIWVCEIGGGILGFAYFPGTAGASYDGAVIDYRYFGTMGTATAPYNKGRTATHEIGHWLGLSHIWGDGPCGQDDGIADTPESDAANYSCSLTHVSCGTTDMVQNYMDYTNDACMNIFTQGQKSVMQGTLASTRGSLVFSQGCVPTGGGGGTSSCDSTMLNFPLTGTPTVYLSGGSGAWGWISGHNNYADVAKAEYFDNASGFTGCDGVRLQFGIGTGTGTVTVNIWDDNAGQPGSVLGTTTLPISDIVSNAGDVTVMFPSTVTLSGAFYAGIEFVYAPGDSVALFTNTDGDQSTATAWEKWNTGDWYPYDDGSSWGLALGHAVFPIVTGGAVTVSVSPAAPTIAAGGNVTLTASGASTYTWSPSTGLSATTGSSVTASPTSTTTYTVIGEDGGCADTTTVTVTVTGVSIDDPRFAQSVQIYPNPTEGQFVLAFEYIERNDLDVEVYNHLGQVVYRESLSDFIGNYKKNIDLSGEARGMYFVSISDGVNRHTKKVILK